MANDGMTAIHDQARSNRSTRSTGASASTCGGGPKSPINTKDYGPGDHGQRRKKPTDYGLQLMAKQKLKGYYGNIGEKQFHHYYEEAIRRRGDTSENLIGLLERRLDAAVYRLKFVTTPFAARQFISHGHVKVNGRRVTIASYMVKEGDVIEVKDKSRDLIFVLEAVQIAGARRSRLPRARPEPHARHLPAHAEAAGRALSGADGAEPGHRVLLALKPAPTDGRLELPNRGVTVMAGLVPAIHASPQADRPTDARGSVAQDDGRRCLLSASPMLHLFDCQYAVLLVSASSNSIIR